MKNKKVSIIIPVYNEEKEIAACLESLNSQSYKNLEIIVIDDGSTDKTPEVLSTLIFRRKTRERAQSQLSTLKLLHQQHKGPGTARNLGAAKASGEILVFVDADMTFDKDFIKDIIKPILESQTIGTFSKNEMVSNATNPWSICWNINRSIPPERMLPTDYPNEAPVFRAILKSKFDQVGGFETTGQYTDDWSLSQKLGLKSKAAQGATYYHTNPSSLSEVWNQARWIGKNDFLIGSLLRKLKSFLIFNPATSLTVAVFKSIFFQNPNFIIFKLTYDFAVLTSLLKSFQKEAKAK